MTIRLRTAFIIGFILLTIWFLYLERGILTPFIAAAIFAYVFNPIVNFFSHKIRLPRTLSVLVVYFVLISIFTIFLISLGRGLIVESGEFKSSVEHLLSGAKQEINLLPPYARPAVVETLKTIGNSDIFKNSSYFFQFFPKAVSSIISFLIFIFASFYFLREGRNIIDRFLLLVPSDYKIEIEILLRRINTVLGGYLRGQIFMIFLVSSVLFVALYLLGVKFALIIAIFSGIAEIVPIIGPIVATVVAVISVLAGGGSSNFDLTPIQTSIIVVVIYFVVRQIQDYFILPHVMGRITKLHPVVILFAVLAGGHIGGILGLLLAVPIAAVLKILLEFFSDAINDRESILENKKPGR